MTCIVFCFFYSMCFWEHSRLTSTLESRCTLPCYDLWNQSPLTWARALQFPTLLNGLAQPHKLMADRPCGEFTFYIYCWDFWQMRSSSQVFIENLMYSVLCLSLWSLPPEAIRVSIRGLVTSLNWTVRLKSLRLRISHEGVDSRGEALSILVRGIQEPREKWKGHVRCGSYRLSAFIQGDGGCLCSADTVLGASPERAFVPWEHCWVCFLYRSSAGELSDTGIASCTCPTTN